MCDKNQPIRHDWRSTKIHSQYSTHLWNTPRQSVGTGTCERQCGRGVTPASVTPFLVYASSLTDSFPPGHCLSDNLFFFMGTYLSTGLRFASKETNNLLVLSVGAFWWPIRGQPKVRVRMQSGRGLRWQQQLSSHHVYAIIPRHSSQLCSQLYNRDMILWSCDRSPWREGSLKSTCKQNPLSHLLPILQQRWQL